MSSFDGLLPPILGQKEVRLIAIAIEIIVAKSKAGISTTLFCSSFKPHQALLVIDSDAKLQFYLNQVPEVAWELLDVADKPLTIIFDGARNLAPNVVAEDGSVALRITRELFSKQLCFRMKRAIVSTSANISGEPAAQNYCDIDPRIVEAVDYVCWSRRQEHKPHQPSSIIRLKENGEVSIIRK